MKWLFKRTAQVLFSSAMIIVAHGLFVKTSQAQSPLGVPVTIEIPAAQLDKPAVDSKVSPDVATMDAIIAAVYDAISGPAGKKRDWDRFRSLFIPEARLIPVVPKQEGGFTTRALTTEDYINRSGPVLERDGFFEKEIARRVEQFGHIAHVFSTYEGRRKADDKTPFLRGINSFQLMYDGKRWWVVTIFWDPERPDSPIPQKYLKSSGQ